MNNFNSFTYILFRVFVMKIWHRSAFQLPNIHRKLFQTSLLNHTVKTSPGCVLFVSDFHLYCFQRNCNTHGFTGDCIFINYNRACHTPYIWDYSEKIITQIWSKHEGKGRYISICTCMYTHTHTHTHTYIHTYTHTHIYIHTYIHDYYSHILLV